MLELCAGRLRSLTLSLNDNSNSKGKPGLYIYVSHDQKPCHPHCSTLLAAKPCTMGTHQSGTPVGHAGKLWSGLEILLSKYLGGIHSSS